MAVADRHIGFGVIGAGEIARMSTLGFAGDSKARVTAVADVNRAAAEAFAKDMGDAKVYGDWREMLRDPRVEAVYVATPPYLHREMVLACVDAGKHVLCEKPLMMNAAEVAEIARACEMKRGVKVASCSSRFLNAVAVKVKGMISSGDLGEIERVSLVMSRAGTPSVPEWSNWRSDPAKAGGGLVMDWGVYDLDWLSFVLGEKFAPVQLVAEIGRMRGPVETNFAVTLWCENGMRIDWARRGTELGPTKDWVEFRGSRAGLDAPMIPTEKNLVLHRMDGEKMTSVTIIDGVREWKPEVVRPIRDFADAIVEERDPLSPVKRQLLVHQIIDAVYRSARDRTVVNLA
jgi:predicted dehydrogenase